MIVGKIISSPKSISKFKNGDVVLAYAGVADYSLLNFEDIICKIKRMCHTKSTCVLIHYFLQLGL